nr:hypothetical protein [Deinococcus sp. KSM4-11]
MAPGQFRHTQVRPDGVDVLREFVGRAVQHAEGGGLAVRRHDVHAARQGRHAGTDVRQGGVPVEQPCLRDLTV